MDKYDNFILILIAFVVVSSVMLLEIERHFEILNMPFNEDIRIIPFSMFLLSGILVLFKKQIKKIGKILKGQKDIKWCYHQGGIQFYPNSTNDFFIHHCLECGYTWTHNEPGWRAERSVL